MVDRKPNRNDVRTIEVPATHIAEELKNARLANIVALGCYVRASSVVAPESVVSTVPKMLGDDRKELILPNVEAFRAGLEWRPM
jgi:2-oxoglutarate ferredoxin oxidoreductase subunit gamma